MQAAVLKAIPVTERMQSKIEIQFQEILTRGMYSLEKCKYDIRKNRMIALNPQP